MKIQIIKSGTIKTKKQGMTCDVPDRRAADGEEVVGDSSETRTAQARVTDVSLLRSPRCRVADVRRSGNLHDRALFSTRSQQCSRPGDRTWCQAVPCRTDERRTAPSQFRRPYLNRGSPRAGQLPRTDSISSIRLRANVTFHDGSAADAEAIATILNAQLPEPLEDGRRMSNRSRRKGREKSRSICGVRRHCCPDSLMDVQIVKTGTADVAIGAFKTADEPNAKDAQVIAHDDYYLGGLNSGDWQVSTYPNVRAAWADMLRDQLDMLYEVGNEAIDTMQAATKVSLYAFERPYQYVIFLNHRNAKAERRPPCGRL